MSDGAEPKRAFKGSIEARYNDTRRARYGNPMASTKQFLESLGPYRQVPWGYSIVSRLPLVSCEYETCKAFMFLDGSIGGHAHVYGLESGRAYVEFFVSELRRRNRKKAKLFSVCGFNSGALKEFCREYDELEFIDLGISQNSRIKDVVLLPSAREVVIFTEKAEKRLRIL